jgi:hypothetical protein
MPGQMVGLSQAFEPAVLRGIKVDPLDPFKFVFILDPGDSGLQSEALKDESTRLIRYFLASVTTPEKDFWVNLSPYEKDRIIPEAFGTTEMGRDLLSQDYILKQVTASLMYPEDELGQAFWKEVYAKAFDAYGTTDVPLDTFNKVWITPDKAEVYEDKGVAFIGESHLKVMLESDYLAASKSDAVAADPARPDEGTSAMTKEIIRNVMLPVIEKEVNEGRNFAQLRQVYQSLILAVWYKKRLKDSVLSKVYADRNKVSGVDIEDKKESEKIWAQYVEAFKKGAYNYIKDEVDQYTQEMIPRKYFSGGVDAAETFRVANFQPLTTDVIRERENLSAVVIDMLPLDGRPVNTSSEVKGQEVSEIDIIGMSQADRSEVTGNDLQRILSLEGLLGDEDPRVRETVVTAVGALYLKRAEQGQEVDLNVLEARLQGESDWSVKRTNEKILAALKTAQQGQVTAPNVLSSGLQSEDGLTPEALNVLYMKMVEEGQNTSIDALKDRLKSESDRRVRQTIATALGAVYLNMMEQGQRISPDILEEHLQMEGDWRVRRAIVTALNVLYLKMAKEGQKISLDVFLNVLQGESIWTIRQAIVRGLASLYLEMPEQSRVVSEDQAKSDLLNRKRTEFWNDNQLFLLGTNAYVLDHVFRLNDSELEETQRLLTGEADEIGVTSVFAAFNANNNKMPKDRQLNPETFKTKYLPLVYALEILLPGKVTQDLIWLFRDSPTPGAVMRFLDSKRSFLLSAQNMQALQRVLLRMKEEHDNKYQNKQKSPDKQNKFRFNTGALFKAINIIAAFTDIGRRVQGEDVLNAVSGTMRVEDLPKHLEGAFLKELADYFGLAGEDISANVRQKLNLSFLSRIQTASDFIKEKQPLKHDRFMALVKAMLGDRFWDFIENEQQSDEQGALIAKHNALVTQELEKQGINVDRWVGKELKERMPDSPFMYYQKTQQTYNPMADARDVVDSLNEMFDIGVTDEQKKVGITDEQKKALAASLRNIGLIIKYDGEQKAVEILAEGMKSTKDIIGVISQPHNLDKILKMQQELMSAENVSGDPFLLEKVTFWGGRIDQVRSGLNDPEYKKAFDYPRRYFTLRPIMHNPGHDLFLGDLTNSCVAMNSKMHPDGMMERLIDKGLNAIEVIDEDTKMPVAAAWLYVAEDGGVVIHNMEINAKDEHMQPLKDEVGSAMVNYVQRFASYIGAKRVLIGKPAYSKYGNFVEEKYKNNEVPFGLDKIGGYLGTDYFLDTVKKSAYLVTTGTEVLTGNNAASVATGGIDLNPAQMNMSITGDGSAAINAFDPAIFEQLQGVQGFIPVILNIMPVNDLPAFFGISSSADQTPVAVNS